jgi:hypothetical protein
MADIQNIDLGVTADDGTGDTARQGGAKINQNFAALNQELSDLNDSKEEVGVSGVVAAAAVDAHEDEFDHALLHVPVTQGSGISVSGQVVTNIDKGTTSRAGHEAAYDHTKLHDPVTAGAGITVADQVVGNADRGSVARTAHENAFDHSKIDTALQEESDTLDSVTGRGAVTLNPIEIGGATTPWVQLDTEFADGTAEGRMQWNSDDGTAEIGMPGGNVNLQIGQEQLIRVRNNSGTNILNGQAVYVSGSTGANIRVALAQANTAMSSHVIGLATENIDDGDFGYVTSLGLVRGINTDSFLEGDELFLDATTPGALTKVKPVPPNYCTFIGNVVVKGVGNGAILVRPHAEPFDLVAAKADDDDGTSNAIEVYNSSNEKTFEIRDNGHYRSIGNAWKDMIADLFGKRLLSTAGKVDYDYEENAIIFKASGDITNADDRVGGNQEINHEMMIGTDIVFKPHIHWWQQVTSGAVVSHIWTCRWRLQRNGQAKATSWNTITANANTAKDVFDFSASPDGLYNQLTRFDDITVTCGVSDTIQIQLTRSDANAGDIAVTFFDLHGRVDSDGSDGEISKT